MVLYIKSTLYEKYVISELNSRGRTNNRQNLGNLIKTLRQEIDKRKYYKENILHYTTTTFQLLFYKTKYPNVDHHTRGKWFIHGPKRRKKKQLQSLELPCWLS